MSMEPMRLGERGRGPEGEPRVVDFRLFLQLQVFTNCLHRERVQTALEEAAGADPAFVGVLYQDMSDPRGIGVLTAREDPAFFIDDWRDLLLSESFRSLTPRPAFTMTGRTYTIGYEANLEDVLLHRTIRRMLAPEYPWAIWYPLRRAGTFEQLSGEEQKEILMEHAGLGMRFSQAGYGQDIRLACHGLDTHDNDFVVGLLGPDLYPLSAMVQTMRKTQQTARHLERLGPFFLGRVIWQSALPESASPPE